MNAQMIGQLQMETYFMMNLEIAYPGVRKWFQMAGEPSDDLFLFRALLMPDKLPMEQQVSFAQMIIFRHEDVFFQMHRGLSTDDPLHQLLVRLLNVRTLRGDDEALLNLWEELKRDKTSEQPKYAPIHDFFCK
jgi:hypothetical protein